MFIFDAITRALGKIFYLIYQLVGNYGFALIIFTVLIKICMVPMSIKQQKSTIKMQQIQPMLKDIQEKYKNDQQKLQMETMKLYKEHNVKIMAGCLPMLIQLPILICLYQVISYPLTYIFGMTDAQCWKWVSEVRLDNGMMLNEALVAKVGGFTDSSAQIMAATHHGFLNFTFCGLNLSATPFQGWTPNLLWIIPILAAVTTYLTSKLSMVQAKKKEDPQAPKKPQRVLNPEAKPDKSNQQQQTTKTMSAIMPFLTLWLAMTYSASLGFYWLISNVFAIFQQMYINKKYGSLYAEQIGEIMQEKEYEQKIKRLNKRRKKK